MKVLYVIHAFYWAGAEKLVYDLSQNIASKVDRVDVVALYRQNTDTEAEMIRTVESKGVHVTILDKGTGADRIKALIRLHSIIRDVQPDIIHGHCFLPALYGKAVGMLNHIPVIYTVHTTKGHHKYIERFTAWMVAGFVSIGAGAEEYMVRDLKMSPRKIHRIYNAVDMNIFNKQRVASDFWEPYGGKSGDIAVVNVARVSKEKNQICILRAVKECLAHGFKNINLYILGVYYEEETLFRQLKQYIHDNSLENNVHFLGMQSNVSAFLSNADCFVMTSWYEGLSVSFLEAVVTETPIIVTDMPFVRELNGISLCSDVIAQDDSHALAEKLMNREFHAPSQKTVELFKQKFSMDSFVAEHIKLYRNILANTQ